MRHQFFATERGGILVQRGYGDGERGREERMGVSAYGRVGVSGIGDCPARCLVWLDGETDAELPI